jgi:hypothetical protein
MIKLYKQNCGSKIAVGIEGDEQGITERFNSFWNHGATDGEFHWQTLTRGYFWTTEEKLKKAIFNATLFELWNKYPEMEDDEPTSESQARDIAAHRFTTIENKPDLVSFATASVTPFATEVDLENYNWNGTRKK